MRHTRYQAVVLRHDAVVLVRCAFKNGPTVWMLPGGGREEGEDELTCVAREVREETGLEVRVDRLLFDRPATPGGLYVRWRTYLCTVLRGEATVGGGEGDTAELIDVAWLPMRDETTWPADVRADAVLYPQLQDIRAELVTAR